MPDEKCPRCGAGVLKMGVSLVSEIPVATYTCGTKQADAAPLQSEACRTIASLTQQLADAEKQIAALTADHSSECPKCNASIASLVAREEGCINCERVVAVQQLADARLLARAYMLNSLEDFDETRVVLRNGNYASLMNVERDADNFPFLTGEMRAALVKAVGDTQ